MKIRRCETPKTIRVELLLVVWLAAFGLAKGQDPVPNAAGKNLDAVVQQTAQQVLSACQSWPPKLAASEKDRTKAPNDSKLIDGTNIITSQLAGSLSIDGKVQPFVYGGSFLRLLDSIGTFDPAIGDKNLLGIGTKIDPAQLNLWGLDQITVKHDCMSLLALVGKAGANYSIPFFSLSAAFEASRNVSSNQVSTFILGTFQSPYEKLSDPKVDPNQRLFAALKALNWRLHATDANKNQYVSTIHVLAINKNVTTAESASVLANLKAGVNFQILNASGSVAGQLGNSLQANGDSYITYFWDYKMGRLPENNVLIDTISQSFGEGLAPDNTQVTLMNTITVSGTISGWPRELCDKNLWTLKTGTNFSPGQLDMKIVPTSSAFDQCNISAAFSLSSAAAAKLNQAGTTLDVASPGLLLNSAPNGNVSIPLRVTKSLYLAGKPSIKVDPVTAKWATIVDSTSGQKASVKWIVAGHIEVPVGRIISTIGPGEFVCKSQEGKTSSLNLDTVQITKSPTPTDSGFAMDVRLSLTGVPSFDDDFNQANKQTCVISGSLNVGTTAVGGGGSQSDLVNLQTNVVYYPNPLPTKAPPAPVGLAASAGNAQISLTWSASNGSTSYNIYRATTAGAETSGTPINKVPITSTSYIDTGLVNGTTYFYVVKAVNGIGSSENSTEVSGTPKP
jgi:hypothetical protein